MSAAACTAGRAAGLSVAGSLLSLLIIAGSLAAQPATLCRTIDRVSSLDPVHAQSAAAARAVALVYETLLEYDYLARPYRLRGGVAKGLPTISPDGKTLTFHLRQDVFFGPSESLGTTPEGQPETRRLVAEDVIYSLKRMADTKLSGASYWILEGHIRGLDEFRDASRLEKPTDYDKPVEGLQAPSPDTLIISLAGPAPQLLWGLAMPCTAIVPREAVEKEGSRFGHKEAGSGAFRLIAWRRDYRMLFERRPGRNPERDQTPLLPDALQTRPIERLRFLTMDDPSTRWLAFMNGDLDIEGDIPRENWDAVISQDGELAESLQKRGIQLHRQSSLDTFYIGFNMDDPLIGTNHYLRQALNAAFDFEAWESLSPGRMDRATGPIPPNVAGRLDSPFAFSFDLCNAEKLLEKAGFPGGADPATGRRLTLQLELGRTDQETRESTELMAAFLERIGIVLEASYHNWPTFLERVGRREAQMFRVGWLADYPDAENFLQLFYSRNASPGPNRCNYSNPAYDELYEEARRTSDESWRLQLYRAMQSILREDCPWLYLYHQRNVALTQARLRNFRMHDFPYGMEKHWRLAE